MDKGAASGEWQYRRGIARAIIALAHVKRVIDLIMGDLAGFEGGRRAGVVRRLMIWNSGGDFGAGVIGSSGSCYAA